MYSTEVQRKTPTNDSKASHYLGDALVSGKSAPDRSAGRLSCRYAHPCATGTIETQHGVCAAPGSCDRLPSLMLSIAARARVPAISRCGNRGRAMTRAVRTREPLSVYDVELPASACHIPRVATDSQYPLKKSLKNQKRGKNWHRSIESTVNSVLVTESSDSRRRLPPPTSKPTLLHCPSSRPFPPILSLLP